LLGVLNVTPDSFSDGGRWFSTAAAVERAGAMLDEGADVIDVGGESTRPQGATPVSPKEEIERVVPVIAEIVARYPSCVVSVDTVKSKVAEAALDAGAHIVNDVSAFRLDSKLAAVCAEREAGVVLMHSRGDVADMATNRYAAYGADPVGEIISELLDSVARAVQRGVSAASIVVDPGIGFAKLTGHSLRVLRELRRFEEMGYPLLVGVSRKRLIGELSGVQEAGERVFGSVAAAVVALMNGAMLFRVHDVRPTRQALDTAWGLITEGEG
jgi:dihydropteroate synthase